MPEIVYVDEYQPSSAELTVGKDPIYRTSDDRERISVRAIGAPQLVRVAVPVAIGLAALYLLLKD